MPTGKDIVNTTRAPNDGGKWTRYASYSVVAALEGKTISYRASFLFSGNGKTEEILAYDYAAWGVGSCIQASVYPSALLDTAYRELPFVQAWIIANEIHSCKKLAVPEVCCDPVTGHCGVASEDMQRSLSSAIDSDARDLLFPNARHTAQKEEKK